MLLALHTLPSMTATHELVVPRSMPIISPPAARMELALHQASEPPISTADPGPMFQPLQATKTAARVSGRSPERPSGVMVQRPRDALTALRSTPDVRPGHEGTPTAG